MKLILTILTVFSFSLNGLIAQITIVSSDIKAINSVASQTEDSEPDASIQPGASGEQNWDFSALKIDGALEFTFVEPSATPHFAMYPDANVASEQDGNYFYFTQTDTELQALGTVGDFNYQSFVVPAAITIDPPLDLLRFPATLGDSYAQVVVQKATIEGSTIGLPYDSVRIERTLDRTINIDAYGDMTTPLGTFETIRSTEVEMISDEVYGLSNGMWQVLPLGSDDEITIYNWWTKDGNFGFPVVQVQTDTDGDVTGANWVTDFVSDAEEAFDLQFKLYPNPTPDVIFVEFPEFFTGTMEVMDINGQSLVQQTASNLKESLNVGNLPTGTYVLLIKETDGTLTAAKRFQIAK